MNYSTKKKILFIIESLRDGGAEKALIEMLSNFDYNYYNVSLCVIFSGEAYWNGTYWKEIPKEVKTIVLYKKHNSFCRKSFRFYKKYGFATLLSFQLKRKTENQYDTIISFLEGRSLLLHNIIRKRARNNITWVHCDLANNHWTVRDFHSLKHEIKCYSNMDEIIFVSSQIMENFSNTFKIKTPKRCIYNIVNYERINKLALLQPIKHESFTITCIGSLYKVKAYDRIIRVARLLKNENLQIHFQLIGQGEEEVNLKKLCTELDVQDLVSFVGFKQNPYPYLKNSDIFICPSLSESFSLVICEAMCLGVPVIATKTAGALEVLENGKYGIIAEQNDASIYLSIRKMIDNTELRKYYQQKAQLRAKVLFDTNKVLSQIYKVINK